MQLQVSSALNSLLDSQPFSLVWASKQAILFRSTETPNDQDNHAKMRLVLVKRQEMDFSLLKKVDSVNGFDIVDRLNEFYLTYSSYLGSNVQYLFCFDKRLDLLDELNPQKNVPSILILEKNASLKSHSFFLKIQN
jgi:hypothetical protein